VKSVLITGASRGIGRELALAFGRAGFAVGVNYVKEKAAAEKVVQEIWEAGNKEAEVFPCDVRDSLKVRQMMDAVIIRWKRLDVLINNAGVTRDRTILKMTNGEWNEVLDTNLTGAFWCIREAARIMSQVQRGAIINIASIMGARGGYGNANYSAAKAGLIGLTRSAARELGRFQITVNAVLPGFHETDMASTLTDEIRKRVVAEHVLGRSTNMNDLTRMVLEIAQNASLSGQVFNVDSRILV
jgi:3-oxoacyl-[acyl-carrier protein] reductase